MQYAICEISGRQYLVRPGQTIEVDKVATDAGKVTVEKILLLVEDSKVEVGTPYLKKSLSFEVLGSVMKPKVRVATYKAKANFRKVRGQRREVSRVRLIDEDVEATKKSVKKS